MCDFFVAYFDKVVIFPLLGTHFIHLRPGRHGNKRLYDVDCLFITALVNKIDETVECTFTRAYISTLLLNPMISFWHES